MDERAELAARLLQGDALPGFAESARFEARSVTGGSYTIVELTTCAEAPQHAAGSDCARYKRYRTAWAGLPVVANDDGSFTVVDTDTRLVRSDRA
jgi:hypothetical protein